MSETRPRAVLAPISPNRVAKASALKYQKHTSRLPVRRSPGASKSTSPYTSMDESDQNDTQTSIPRSDTSNVSNLSLLSDQTPTDDLGRRILEHARWTKHSALEAGAVKMQPFARAKPTPHLAAAMSSVETRDESVAGQEETIRRSNVPRQWGTKGRQRNDFLRRLTATTNPTNQLQEEDDAKLDRATERDLDQKVFPAEDVALPSVETESPPRGISNRKPGDFGYRRRGQRNVAPATATNEKSGNAEYNQDVKSTSLAQAFARVGSTERTSGSDLPQDNDKPRAELRPMRRHGSRDLLKQLARAASATPSPSPGHDDRVASIVKEADHRLPTPPDDGGDRLMTQPKTPIVTGAWVDTPASRNQRDKSRNSPQNRPTFQLPTSNLGIKEEEARQGTHGPKSALEAILRSGEDNMSNDPLGESTIASLKDLVAQDEAGELSAILHLDEDTLNLVNNVTVPVHQGQELRSEEKEALQRMSEALKSARLGLRDASRGIKRVEHQFEEVGKKQSLAHSGKVCDRCGCPANVTLTSILAAAWRSFLSNFYSWPRGGRLQLTWLGLFTLILLTWMTTEFTLCEFYCHPFYAKSMVGYGVDINAPRLPYVTTTIMFKRPFGWFVGPFWRLARHMVSSMLQSLLSSVTEDYAAGATTERAASVTGKAFGSASRAVFGHDFGFGQDEII